MFELSNAISRILPGMRPELIQVPPLNPVPGKSYLVHEGLICSCMSSASGSSWLQNPHKEPLTLQKLPAQHRAPLLTHQLLRKEMGRDKDTRGVLRRQALVRHSWKQALLTKGSCLSEAQSPGMTHAGVETTMRAGGQTAAHNSKGVGWTGYNMQGKWGKVESRKEGG